MVTTHSPAFIDLSRDNTTVVRVGRDTGGEIVGTTVFRPQKIKLDADQKRELKLLNIFDPHVAEFFFGGRSIIVEGDTEYTVFRYIANEFPEFKNLHVIRARGKATIALLSKILNQFSARYAVLHDSDSPTMKGKDGKAMANPAWTSNDLIRQEVSKAPDASRVRLAALVPGFEKALFGFESRAEKPYKALEFIKTDAPARAKVKDLLVALTDFSKPLPSGCCEWPSLEKLKEIFEAQTKTQ
jgi:putative ATP-dependent endonuclease of OLD family